MILHMPLHLHWQKRCKWKSMERIYTNDKEYGW